MVLVLTMVVLQSISFANYALTTKTTNIIYGSAPYLTFDGGRTRVTNTEALLGITLSDGRTFTPTTNNSSSTNPIELPVVGQSFNDIGMLVPTDTNSIALSSLIGTPYNYWGDDDGDGQGVNGITATGRLYLSITDSWGLSVERNKVLSCGAIYRLTLSNSEGILKTRYGVPNESRFSGGRVTYYIKPKVAPRICTARPNFRYDDLRYIGSSRTWSTRGGSGFIPQSFTPSSYGLNFPTAGADYLKFILEIDGLNQNLSWAPVSHGGITATMYDSTSTRVEVILRGPVATPSQWNSDNPGRIDSLSLPQTFELVGRDSSGNAVLKYGFVLKQWFVNRGDSNTYTYSSMESWCNKIGGYRLPKAKDLTNATCSPGRGASQDMCQSFEGARPSSSYNNYMRNIGGGLFAEWGKMSRNDIYTRANFFGFYLTQDRGGSSGQTYFVVDSSNGEVSSTGAAGTAFGLCVYP